MADLFISAMTEYGGMPRDDPLLTLTSVDLYLIRAWRCSNFHDRFLSVQMNRTRTALGMPSC